MSGALEAAARFAALGDPIRLAIVRRLSDGGPLSSVELRPQAEGVTRQGLAKHLRVLEGAGLVESRRVGRDLRWAVRAQEVAALGDMLATMSAAWDARLERLRAFVEN